MSPTEWVFAAAAICLAIIVSPALSQGPALLRSDRHSGGWVLMQLGVIVIATDVGLALAAIRAFGA